ncbi:RNA polymerase sigma factor [Flavitalea flava]
MIKGCLKNDRKTQEELYRRFYQVMMVLCVRYTKNEQEAVEVLNDGFLKVFMNIALYDAKQASFYTWVRKIIINTAIDFLRREQLYLNGDLVLQEKEEPVIENDAIRKLNSEDLLKVVRQLPSATRLVFNLYTIDGFNHREIASLLKISEGTSKWHLSEARKHLKRIINLMELHP